MSEFGGGYQGERFGRKVYHSSAGWKIFALIFPLFGLGCLIALLSVTWPNAVQSGDLLLIYFALPTGLAIATLCFWAFAMVWRGTRLIISPDGIVYESWGFSISSTWDNVVALDRMVMGASEQEGLRLREPGMRANWFVMLGMLTPRARNRIDPEKWSRFIPLTYFRPDWERETLGRSIRSFAPQVFEGQTPTTGDRPPARTAPPFVAARRVSPWLVLSLVVALEAAGSVAALLYAGSEVLPSRIFNSAAGDFLTFSPDGKMLASGGGNEVQLWNVRTGSVVRTIPHGAVGGVAFSPDGGTIGTGETVWDAAGNAKRSVLILSTASGAIVRRINSLTGNDVSSVLFTPDGSMIVAGSESDNTVHVWRASTGALVRTIYATGMGNIVDTPVVLDGGGKTILTLGDGAPNQWRLSDGKSLGTFPTEQLTIFAMAGRPNGESFALGGANEYIEVDTADGGQIGTFTPDNFGDRLALSSDGRLLAASYDNGPVNLWRVRDGALLATVRVATDHYSGAGPLAISPDDRELATVDGQNIRLWNIARFTS